MAFNFLHRGEKLSDCHHSCRGADDVLVFLEWHFLKQRFNNVKFILYK